MANTSDWAAARAAVEACTACPLRETCRQTVFGVGSETAEVLFVGEGPGKTEDEEGVPFVGPAGKLLDELLAAIGLTREHVYIANIVKCRPPMNRDPKPEERAACMPHLKRQMELLAPKLVVCLGRIAAQELISPEFRVTQEHGFWNIRGSYEIMGTWHPAALLRNERNLPDAFEDFKVLQRRIRKVCKRTPSDPIELCAGRVQ